MGKKKTLKLSSLLLRNTELVKCSSSSSSSWRWPSCHQPRTLSFRANNNLDATMDMLESSQSLFTVSPNSASFSTASDQEQSRKRDSIETVIRGLRSDRLFFEPDETNSILESNNKTASEEAATLPFKDSVVLSMESQDPYVDFRKSMEEMVAAHDVKDWECLQELLCWYLKVNEKTNHGYIVGAFVDLLVCLAFASASSSFSSTSTSSSSTSYSPSSPLSFYSSSMSSSCCTRCVSCLEAEEEVNNTPSSSSSLLEQVREEIDREDEAQAEASSSSSSTT